MKTRNVLLSAIACGTGLALAGCPDAVQPVAHTSLASSGSASGAGGLGGAGGATASSGTVGSGGAKTCSNASKCPGGDTECSTRTCDLGICGVAYAPATKVLTAQTPGDCQRLVCDGKGGTTSQNDDTDVPPAPKDCTKASCVAGKPTFDPVSTGTGCATDGGKVCTAAGKCVACVVSTDCSAGAACDVTNHCVSAACSNGKKDGDETDLDCGGSCSPCGPGKHCLKGGDCAGGQCPSNICAPTCTDGTKNQTETDVDCGGPCGGCATNKACGAAKDCLSGLCTAGACANRLLISQVQTRGAAGAFDEFIELYNPTSVAVAFGSTWTISARTAVLPLAFGNCANNAVVQVYQGLNQMIPPHHHLLLVNSAGYAGATTHDGTLLNALDDASSIELDHAGAHIDALCFSYDGTTKATLNTCTQPAAYVCEGAPASNSPHNNSDLGGSNVDSSLERRPGGAAGNGTDTNVSANDFQQNLQPAPRNLASPPAP